MKKILIVAMLCMALVATMAPAAAAADTNYAQCMAAIQEQKTIQAQAHKTATTLRKKGYKDSSAYVQAAKSTMTSHRLTPMLTMFCTMAIYMGYLAFCMPRNHPVKL